MNSHIIPEFMYKKVYNKNPNHYYTIRIGNVNQTKKKEQKGIREYLFCSSCEGILNEFETYASKLIYAKNNINEIILNKIIRNETNSLILYEFENMDYTKFKLFQMSLLWRLIISSKFETINIGEHSEKLRTAILNKDPLEEFQYGCNLHLILYQKGKKAGKFILNPYFTKFGITDFMNVLIDGYMYNFAITDDKILPINISENFLKQNGRLNIVGRLIFEDRPLFEKVSKVSDFYKKEINDNSQQ